MFKKLPLYLLITAALTACGGSDSTEEAPVIDDKPVTPPNTAPVANKDTGATLNTDAVTINALANDEDADGDSLSIVEIKAAPENGSAVIDENGITYTPNEGYVGEDTIVYVISDGIDTAEASISILVTAPNEAPVANADIADTVNNNTVIIDVLVNDTDPGNSTLTIAEIKTPPQFGTATISEGKIAYTPNEGHIGTDSFVYVTTDGDLSSEAIVNISVAQNITLSGTVTDSPIANADVTVTIGEQAFTTAAEANGDYSLDVTLTSLDGMMFVSAKGSADNQQENVELVAMLGSVEELFDKAGNDFALNNEENDLTNVTHVSTAKYLLAVDRNDHQPITTAEQFDKLVDDTPTNKLIDTAAFIKLLVDNPSYTVTEGETTYSILQGDVDIKTPDAINDFLASNELLDESGNPIYAYLNDLNLAVEEIVNDPKVTQQFTAEMVIDKPLTLFETAQEGWLRDWSQNITLRADGFGYQSWHGDESDKTNVSWHIDNGKLNFSLAPIQDGSSTEFTYPFDDIAERFGQEAADYCKQWYEETYKEDLENNILTSYWNITEQKHAEISLIEATDSVFKVTSKTTSTEILELKERYNSTWSKDNPTSDTLHHGNTYTDIQYSYKSEWEGLSVDDIQGNWAMPIAYIISHDNDTDQFWHIIDNVAINSTGSTGEYLGNNVTTSMTNGVLKLTDGNWERTITPFAKINKTMLVLAQLHIDGELTSSAIRLMSKFDGTHTQFTDNIVTELPHTYILTVRAWRNWQWDGDAPSIHNIWGHQFNEDGTMLRGITGRYNGDSDSMYIDLGTPWTWEMEDNIISINHLYEDYGQETTIYWEVVSVDDMHRITAIESRTYAFYDENGVKEETRKLGVDRMVILQPQDLSFWETAWENSQNVVIVPEKASRKVQETRTAPLTREEIVEHLMQENSNDSLTPKGSPLSTMPMN